MHSISEMLCDAYRELHANGEVSFELHERQRDALDSIVKTIYARYFGVRRFDTHEKRAVAFLCLIVKDHPVTDGNKRLAVLWFDFYCSTFNLSPHTDPWTLDQIVVSIEKSDLELNELMDSVRWLLFERAREQEQQEAA